MESIKRFFQGSQQSFALLAHQVRQRGRLRSLWPRCILRHRGEELRPSQGEHGKRAAGFQGGLPRSGNAPGLSRPGTHQNKRSPLRPVCGIPGEHGSGKAFLAEKNVLDIIRDLQKDTEDPGRESPETREQRKMVVRWQKGM
jgi:hypothetical protein